MTRKRGVPGAPVLGVPADSSFGPETDVDGLDELDAVLSDLGAGAADVQILVSKFNPDSKARHGFDLCARYQADGFDPFDVARTYGGGRFKFQFARGGKYFRNIERSFLVPHTPQPTAPQHEGGGLAQELRESRQFERQMLLTMMAGAFGKAPGGPQGAIGVSVPDMLSLFEAGRKSAVPASTPLDSIKEAFTLGRELAGDRGARDDDGEDGMPRRGSMLERLAPRALDLIERAFSAAPTVAQASVPARNPGAAPAGVVTAGAPPTPERTDPLAALISQYAPQIMAEARAGRDPRAWGQFIGERAPDSMVPLLAQFAEAPKDQRQAFLANVAPELLAYQDWISQACEGIADVFEPDEDAAQVETTNAGADHAS